MSPNARTVAWYQKQGFLAVTVEFWSPFPKPFGKRHDLLGVFDQLVLKPGGEIWGIQSTTESNVGARIKKMGLSEPLKQWRGLGGHAAVVGWAKRSGPDIKRKTWQPKERILF